MSNPTDSQAESGILLDGFPIPIGLYPAGEPYVTVRPSMNFNRDNHAVTVRYDGVMTMMTALWLVDSLLERGHRVPTLILPYLPGARQDRLNSKGDVLFTAKSIAHEINLRNFRRVVCFDAHSDAMPGMIHRCRNVHIEEIDDLTQSWADPEFGTYDAVVATDEGGVKRAGAVASALKVPLIHGWKHRDVETGKISGFGIEDTLADDTDLLFVDDICDGGGTFVGLAEVVHQRCPNMRLALFVSHGIFSQGLGKLDQHFTSVQTTNSTLFPDHFEGHPILHVTDIIPTLQLKAAS